MNTVSADDLQADFDGYIQRVEAGETLLVTKYGQVIAKIRPVTPTGEGATRAQRPIGLAEGQFVVPDDFDDPLPEEILRDFEGRR